VEEHFVPCHLKQKKKILITYKKTGIVFVSSMMSLILWDKFIRKETAPTRYSYIRTYSSGDFDDIQL
jgi:hypothetical protein